MLSLLRIDDRLIHAQVVIGWGNALHPDRIVVADDRVASSEWEKNLYLTAALPEIKVSILSFKECVNQIRGGVFDSEKIILLVKSPESVLELMEMGLDIDSVNVGSLHYSEGKERILEHVYIDANDRANMRELVKRGVTLEARALPGDRPVNLNSMVV